MNLSVLNVILHAQSENDMIEHSVTHQWKLDTNIHQDISHFIIILQMGTLQLTITGQNRHFSQLLNGYYNRKITGYGGSIAGSWNHIRTEYTGYLTESKFCRAIF